MKVNQGTKSNEYPGKEWGFIDIGALVQTLRSVIDQSELGQKLDDALNLRGRLSEGMGSAESYERAFALKDFLAQQNSTISPRVKDVVEYVADVYLNHPDVQTFFCHTKVASKFPQAGDFDKAFLLASKEINAFGMVEAVLELFGAQVSSAELDHVTRLRRALSETPKALRQSIKDLKSGSKLVEKDFSKVLELLQCFAYRWETLK